ncbi:hypothetical protein GQ53DRAFT_814034 [Thozetella sp. PMI_491]|nr:hypothetical protein GQ53DRAFT_814034 [Thozetella sp. PMI_491]
MQSPKKPRQPESHLEPNFIPLAVYTAAVAYLAALYSWPRRWILSGLPLLFFCLLLGKSFGRRAFKFSSLPAIFIALNLAYAICSTSWLLYGLFAMATYIATGLVCLARFKTVANFVRRRLRAILRNLHFIEDKVALFDIPALEIDTDVDGLFVIRGLTVSLSGLSILAHGIEVGIKLSNDMELAIQCEKVAVKLFRGIWVSDCFANLKGGKYEMTFGKLAERSKDANGDAIFVMGSDLIKAASFHGDTCTFPDQPEKMRSAMTGGKPPNDSSAKSGLSAMESVFADHEDAATRYDERLSFIESTDAAKEARAYLQARSRHSSDPQHSLKSSDWNSLRAATCAQLHHKPSVPHPPQMSVKVTTLKNLTPPYIRRFLHRLPMLLRLLLWPLSYLHPVYISSITASASGAWIDTLLVDQIFKSYTTDSQIAHLKERVSAWLSNADFVVELGGITGLAQVPFFPVHDIYSHLGFGDVMAYRYTPKDAGLKQVVRLGGADASFHLPSFLLPHHEHLLPPPPNVKHEAELQKNIGLADGKPQKALAEHELKQAQRDEANVKISVHARLPACFDQELLDFIAVLVKATKVVDMAKESHSPIDDDDDDDDDAEDRHTVRDFFSGVKGSVKRRVVDGVVNDHWIAKLVGKISKTLEAARGEIGYSGDIPVPLKGYRTACKSLRSH